MNVTQIPVAKGEAAIGHSANSSSGNLSAASVAGGFGQILNAVGSDDAAPAASAPGGAAPQPPLPVPVRPGGVMRVSAAASSGAPAASVQGGKVARGAGLGSGGQTAAGQVSAGDISADQAPADQASTDQVSTDQASAGQASAGQASTDQTSADQTSADQASADHGGEGNGSSREKSKDSSSQEALAALGLPVPLPLLQPQPGSAAAGSVSSGGAARSASDTDAASPPSSAAPAASADGAAHGPANSLPLPVSTDPSSAVPASTDRASRNASVTGSADGDQGSRFADLLGNAAAAAPAGARDKGPVAGSGSAGQDMAGQDKVGSPLDTALVKSGAAKFLAAGDTVTATLAQPADRAPGASAPETVSPQAGSAANSVLPDQTALTQTAPGPAPDAGALSVPAAAVAGTVAAAQSAVGNSKTSSNDPKGPVEANAPLLPVGPQASAIETAAASNAAATGATAQAGSAAVQSSGTQFQDVLAEEAKSGSSGEQTRSSDASQPFQSANLPQAGQPAPAALQGGVQHVTAPASAEAAARAEAATPSPADQVSVGLKHLAASGSNQIQIDLVPANLGRIEVRLQFGHDGSVNAVISADRPDTLSLLQNDSRGLEQSLRDAGLRADSGSLSFNLRGGDTGTNQRQNSAFAGAYAGAGNGSGGSRGGEDYSTPVLASAVQRGLRYDGSLDIQV